MGKYGLLGEKLGHSYSPEIHALLKGYEYKLYEVPKEEVGRFLNETDLSGMNVTIPYKKTVMDYCVSLSDIAKALDFPGTPKTSLYVGIRVATSNSHEAFSTPFVSRAYILSSA